MNKETKALWERVDHALNGYQGDLHNKESVIANILRACKDSDLVFSNPPFKRYIDID